MRSRQVAARHAFGEREACPRRRRRRTRSRTRRARRRSGRRWPPPTLGPIAAHLGSASERPCACRRLQQHAELPLAEGVVLPRRPHVPSIRPAARGQGVRVRGQGRGSASRAASIRRAARAASGATPIEPTAWRKGGRARRVEPRVQPATPGRSACSAGRGQGGSVRAGEGESWHGWAGGASGAERSRSGASGVGAGGAAAGKAATHPAGPPLERAAGRRRWLCTPLRAARGSRPARSGPLRHAHPHPRLAQAAVQHERLQEEDATQRRASASREGNARRASHLEVGGGGEDDAASHDVVGDEGEGGPAGRRGEGVGLPPVGVR